MTLEQQRNALRSEPGFSQLPPETQARIFNRLGQLHAMPSETREKTLRRLEGLERLEPAQREQVRSALRELGGLPFERRRLVARTFHNISKLPAEQRQKAIDSPANSQLTETERGTLRRLVQTAPYIQEMGR
ncbi:DUF3106 domain-containing protein [Terriglobus albidus]|uniref:DUF3106 domain-containing protein n=1 Tax=Terriglobus albidus TaxID=1592106 RepID=UPI0021DF7817|nr:DUF3106 domain-containing protein [Terriglobus albidus]